MEDARIILPPSANCVVSIVYTYTVSAVPFAHTYSVSAADNVNNGPFVDLAETVEATRVRVLPDIEVGEIESTGKPVSIEEVISHIEESLNEREPVIPKTA